jgi:hypothetical protein
MKSLRDYRREAQAEAHRIRTGRFPVKRSKALRIVSAAAAYESHLRATGRGDGFFLTSGKTYYVGQEVTVSGRKGLVTLIRSDRVLIEWIDLHHVDDVGKTEDWLDRGADR